MSEKDFRGFFDAVGSPAEIDSIEVVAQHFVLGLLTVDLHRQDRFLDLAFQRSSLTHVVALHVLLGERGATLSRQSSQIIDEGTRNAFQIYSGVGIESAVFGGNNGLPHIVRQCGRVDDGAIDLRELPHLGGAVRVIHGAGLSQGHLVGLGNIQRGVQEQEGCQSGNNDAEDAEHEGKADAFTP